MITYQQERLADIQPEIEALVPQQWAEMASAEGGFEQFVEKPNWEWYRKFDTAGKGALFTARTRQLPKKVVGYFGAYIYPSTTSGNLIVQSTPYYVVPSLGPMRRGLVLRALIRHAVAAIAPPGSMVAIKTHPWASAAPILKHLGFREVETWYMLPVPLAGKETLDARDSVSTGSGGD